MEQIRIEVHEIPPPRCVVERCEDHPWRRLVIYEPDVIGATEIVVCRGHFLAKRDAYRAFGKQHGVEVVES